MLAAEIRKAMIPEPEPEPEPTGDSPHAARLADQLEPQSFTLASKGIYPHTPLNERQVLLERLLKAHAAYFDTYHNKNVAGRFFPGYAEFHTSTSNYVLVKSAKLWEINSHEYLFFQLSEHLTLEDLQEAVSFMENDMVAHIQSHLEEDHMSSIMSLIIIAGGVDDGVARAVKKVRFRKNFKWGFSGWADLRVAVIDIGSKSVFVNAMGRDLLQTLEANMEDVQASKEEQTKRAEARRMAKGASIGAPVAGKNLFRESLDDLTFAAELHPCLAGEDSEINHEPFETMEASRQRRF